MYECGIPRGIEVGPEAGQYCEHTSQKLVGQGALGAGIGGQVIKAVGVAEEGRRLGPTDGTNRTEGDEDKTGSLLGEAEKLREETTIVGIAVAVKILG